MTVSRLAPEPRRRPSDCPTPGPGSQVQARDTRPADVAPNVAQGGAGTEGSPGSPHGYLIRGDLVPIRSPVWFPVRRSVRSQARLVAALCGQQMPQFANTAGSANEPPIMNDAGMSASHFSPWGTAQKPGWHCDTFEGITPGGCLALCTRSNAARVHSMPVNGCSAFEREPGADDDPDWIPVWITPAPPAVATDRKYGRRRRSPPTLALSWHPRDAVPHRPPATPTPGRRLGPSLERRWTADQLVRTGSKRLESSLHLSPAPVLARRSFASLAVAQSPTVGMAPHQGGHVHPIEDENGPS